MMDFTVQINTDYISASCNPCTACFDVNTNDIICYGSGCSVILCNLKNPAKILHSYVGHTDRVNCVKWLHSLDGTCKYFISGSCDNKFVVWMEKEGKFNPVITVDGHKDSITCIDCVEVSTSLIFIVTTSSDCSTKVWKITRDEENHSFELVDTLKLGGKLVLSVALTLFHNHSVPLVACAAEDQQIHLFLSNDDLQFQKVISLSGHLQWIKCLSFCNDGSDVLMASASQDCYVRVWRISMDDKKQSNDELKLTSDLFACKELMYRVGLETILQSHEGWVNSAHWNKHFTSDGNLPLRLITSSMDKTIIEWGIDEVTGVWLEKVRVGEIGGSNLGFIGARYSSSGEDIVACSFHGAFHLWSKEKNCDLMNPGVTCGGHLGSVMDLCWNKTGEFLLTVGSDQTTRVHAQWKDKNNHNQWYEIARPQIHGYDMRCVCSIDRFSFASGADEKIIRIFKATRNFVTNFSNLCYAEFNEQEIMNFSCDGACVPALGLSNKSVTSSQQVEIESGNYFVPQVFHEPPTEENLMQNTLWPEEQKLYGHGYEVFALACNSDGTIIASACKASQREHANIILWEVGSWKQIAKLVHHTLTVTQLAFSHNDQYLLSVSRDRTWGVFKIKEDAYSIFSSCDKKTTLHSRIIWGCSWSHDDKYFITVSRDKKAIVWQLSSSEVDDEHLRHEPASEALDALESITAVDFAPRLVNGRYLIAFGMENGLIQFYSWMPSHNGVSWNCLVKLDYCLAHHKTLQRVSFRPLSDTKKLQLATCSEDGSVKIFEICLLQECLEI